MKKLQLASLLVASIAASAAVQPAYANENLNSSSANTIQLDESALMSAIKADSANAEEIIAAAIAKAGTDSDETLTILGEAVLAGIDADTVTAVAIASGVDATIASEATAGPFLDHLRGFKQGAHRRAHNTALRVINILTGCGAGISPNC